MPFDLTDFPLAFELPPSASPLSAWLLHVPLVPVLVGLLRPRQIVELGTHAGDSYLAFCRAAKALNAGTQCAAIDTWQGDPFTHQYGPEILTQLRAMHDPQFSSFSRLIQATFDDARPAFPDGSVDLLHIDGAHDYDAVRHDFDSWLPKLSDQAVVLFHDTTERTPTFGVWKLWAEITPGRPNAEIPHGHGLGILAVGKNVPAPFLEFLTALNTRPQLIKTFETLGTHINLLMLWSAAVNTIHDCQATVNQWRARTSQPIVNPTTGPNNAAANFFAFSDATRKDVQKLFADAISVATEVARLRQATPG